MKTIELTPPRELNRENSVKFYLFRVIIALTSENFLIFVTSIGAILCWLGASIDHIRMVGVGALAVIIGLTPRSIREAIKDFKKARTS